MFNWLVLLVFHHFPQFPTKTKNARYLPKVTDIIDCNFFMFFQYFRNSLIAFLSASREYLEFLGITNNSLKLHNIKILFATRLVTSWQHPDDNDKMTLSAVGK